MHALHGLAEVYCMHKIVLFYASTGSRSCSGPSHIESMQLYAGHAYVWGQLELQLLVHVQVTAAQMHNCSVTVIQIALGSSQGHQLPASFCCKPLFLLYHGQGDCEGVNTARLDWHFFFLLHAALAVERLHMFGSLHSCSTSDCSLMLSELQLIQAIAAVP